jgi:choline dehydrogenase-like flavoprotein
MPRLYYPVLDHDKSQLLRGVEMCLRVSAAAGALRVTSSTLPTHGFVNLPPPGSAEDPVEQRAARDEARQKVLQTYIDLVKRNGIVGDNRELIFSAHQMGTCKMSLRPADGVTKDSGETWEVAGLYVVDASVFPTPSGANPMITTLALAQDMATRLAVKLSRVQSPRAARATASASTSSKL